MRHFHRMRHVIEIYSICLQFNIQTLNVEINFFKFEFCMLKCRKKQIVLSLRIKNANLKNCFITFNFRISNCKHIVVNYDCSTINQNDNVRC